MPRQAGPWRRGGGKGPWGAQVRGKQVRLADGTATKMEATEAHRRVQAAAGRGKARRPGGLTFRVAVNLSLELVR